MTTAQLERIDAARDFAIAIQLYPREEECAVCEALIVGGRKGIAMYEGEPVPHDWKGEWGGFSCCEKCFAEFEHVQGDAALRCVWFAEKRRIVRLDQDDYPHWFGDL